MMRRLAGCGLLGLVLLTATATGQDDEKKTEPAKNEALTTIPGGFRSFVVIDDRYDPKDSRNRTGKMHCFVCEHGLVPGVAVIVRSLPKDADAPLFKMLAMLDDAAKKYRADRLGTYCIFLTLDRPYEDDLMRENKVAEVAAVGKQAKLDQVPMAIAEATIPVMDKATVAPQVASYQIGPDDEITVLFYNRFQILNRWVFTKDKPITDEDVKTVRTAIDTLLAPKPRAPRVKKFG